jgi:hypothetical protein
MSFNDNTALTVAALCILLFKLILRKGMSQKGAQTRFSGLRLLRRRGQLIMRENDHLCRVQRI